MDPQRRRFLQCTSAFIASPLAAGRVRAQSYPSRTIKFILSEAPGSSNDLIARLLAPPMSSHLRQPVIVENRPGGGGLIGTRSVLEAPPDGYTLLISSSSALIVSALLNRTAGFDLMREISPIASVARTSWVLVVNPSVPVNSLTELVAYAKASPGKLNVGFAQGTGPQFVAESFKAAAGIDIVGIPYTGGSQVVRDLLGGSIQLYFGSAATTLSLINSGLLKALASTGLSRDPLLPDVQTMKELGYPRMTLNSVLGIFGPARIGAEIVERLHGSIRETMGSPALAEGLMKVGYVPDVQSAQEFSKLLDVHQRIWLPIANELGLTAK